MSDRPRPAVSGYPPRDGAMHHADPAGAQPSLELGDRGAGLMQLLEFVAILFHLRFVFLRVIHLLLLLLVLVVCLFPYHILLLHIFRLLLILLCYLLLLFLCLCLLIFLQF